MTEKRVRVEFRADVETRRRLEALAKIEEGGNKSAWLKRQIDSAWKKLK